jgi:hypothetical protein
MKHAKFPSFLLLAGLFAIMSCAREDSSPSQVEDLVKQAEKDAVFEAVLIKADDQITKEISKLENFNYLIPSSKSAEADPCSPKINVETPANAKFPKTITLDYGSGCTDPEGNFRAGKIIVHITGPYWEKNTVRNSKLVDYMYNDLIIAGDRKEMNKGINDKGYYIFEVKNNEKIRNSKNALLVERNLDRERIYNRGAKLTSNEDDEVWVTGTTRVNRNGKEVIQEITTTLYRKVTCQHFQSGVITTFINKVKTAEFNYGDGICDDKAIWTNGTIKKEITLKSWVNYYSIKPL